MSSRAKANVLKLSSSVLLVAAVLGAAFAVGQAQDKETYGTKYRVVRVPGNVVELEYNTEGKSRKPPMRPVHPLDELAAEGWELVTVVHADGANVKIGGPASGAEAHGGDFVCFLRKRESSPSLPGRR